MILKLKHWQIFIGYIIIIIFIVVPQYLDIGNISPEQFRMIFGVIGLIFCFSWVLLVGLKLNQIKSNPYHFRNGLLILANICCVIGYGSLHFNDLIVKMNFPFFFVAIFPITFFGIFYMFLTVAKSLKSIENEKLVTLDVYIIDAFFLFAFPIGIWFIQPRLNKIYDAIELDLFEK